MAVIDELKNKYNLSYCGESIKIKPTSKWAWVTFPIEDDNYILIIEDEFLGLINHIYQFNDTLDKIEKFNYEQFISNRED